MTIDPELEVLADQFAQWASDQDILSFEYVPIATSASATSESHEAASVRMVELPARRLLGDLRYEFGDKLEVIRRTFENDRIHFVGTSPRPRSLLIAHTKRRPMSGDERLPIRTTNGVQIEYVGGRVPEIRLASAAITAAKTKVMRNGRYPCGTSISIGNVIGAGTLTALVKDESGKLLGLSCNHVTGLCNNTAREMPIVAPGILDVRPRSLDPFTLGHHARVAALTIGTPENVDISANLDAALFSIADPAAVCSMQQNFYDTPTDIHPFVDQITVEKVGRTTGHTRGTLLGDSKRILPVPTDVGVLKGTIYYRKIMLVLSTHGIFADKGDSGALVVTGDRKGKREAIGIVFAVSPDRTKTYVVPIDEVLATLRVSLVGGHNNDARTSGPALPPAAQGNTQ